MKDGRLRDSVTCANCPTVFRPWANARRQRPPTCSHRCKGAVYRRMPDMPARPASDKSYRAEVKQVGQRFGSDLTPREAAIYRYGVKVGRDRGYRAR